MKLSISRRGFFGALAAPYLVRFFPSPRNVWTGTLNGKVFIAFDSTTVRIHVYDPCVSVRRVRLGPV